MTLLDELYANHPNDQIDPDYQPKTATPEQWRNGVIVGEFASDGCGQDCFVVEHRLPARCYDLIIEPGTDTPGFIVTTGTGYEVGKLMFQLARAVSQGMVGLSK